MNAPAGRAPGRSQAGPHPLGGSSAVPGRRGANGQPAFVLHQWDWSETSLILDLFTREQGRLAAVAKGAKRPYSQLRPVLMPFQRLLVLTSKPKRAGSAGSGGSDEGADILLLRSAEYAGAGAALPPARLFSGFYLNELLMKLLPRQDAHPLLFDAYAQTLPALVSRDEVRVQSALRAFEITLLQQVGVLPDLSLVTATLDAVRSDGRYALLPEAGVAPARSHDASVSGAALIQAQAALLHGSLTVLQQACAQALPDWRSVLRGLLHYHLGTPVLRTRQVMLDLQALSALPLNPSPQSSQPVPAAGRP